MTIEVTSPRGQVLLTYTPPLYLGSDLFLSLRQAQGVEYDDLLAALRGELDQFYAANATWDLPIWEYELGIITNPALSVEMRRSAIISKMRRVPPMTPDAVKTLLEAYVGAGNVDSEQIAVYSFDFTVKITGTNITPLAEMLTELGESIPAHLAYQIIIDYYHKLAAKNTYQAWFSSVLPKIGTLSCGGGVWIATNGESAPHKFTLKLTEWFSSLLWRASPTTMPNGSNGESFHQAMTLALTEWLSSTLAVASPTLMPMPGANGESCPHEFILATTTYQSTAFLACGSGIAASQEVKV